jgi:zinc transport system ATP-binding protein
MLHIENLYYAYNNSSPLILNNINLQINKGEYVSILGENGCGKSTLIKLILKLLKPTGGKINLQFNRVGYVPQRLENFNSQFPITVYELLNSNRKVLKIKDISVVSQLLEMVRMQDYKNSLIGTLSGGQLQKVLIAKALMGNPELLILDEPSTGVDVKSQEEIYSLIKALNISKKITVISVEHNLEAAINYSSLIFCMENGKGSICTPTEYSQLNIGGNLRAAL